MTPSKPSKANISSKEFKTILAFHVFRITIFICFYLLFAFMGSAQFDGKPIILTPKDKTIVQRCFIEVEGEKSIFCVAVGAPVKVHYAMDLSQGNLLNIWKGEFLDATTMWTGRGVEQLAKPISNEVIEFSTNPSLALLKDKEDIWPSSMGTSDYQFSGYSLDKRGRPTFKYVFLGANIEDKIIPSEDNQGLSRTLSLSDVDNNSDLWFLLAKGKHIKRLKKGLYSIDGGTYEIRAAIKIKQKPLIKETTDGMELRIPIKIIENNGQLSYSIIWS